jgi:hypothetical protein
VTPDLQFSETNKYIAQPILAIPCPSGLFHIYRAYGQQRDFLAEIPPAELAAYLTAAFAEDKIKPELRQHRPTTNPIELDFSLDNFQL